MFLFPGGFASQKDIDEAYNPGHVVSDMQAEVRHFSDRSARARDQIPCHLDVSYGQTIEEKLDIFNGADRDAPVFIFVHGGYWRACSSKDFSCVAFGPRAMGFCTVCINYALCPQVTIDEIVRQVRSAVAWVYRNIRNYGGDPERIVLAGQSAGAHLVAMTLLTDWRDVYGLPDNLIRGAIVNSGLYDLAPLRYSWLQPAIQLNEGIVRRNSPLLHVRRLPTPLLITGGGMEQKIAFESQAIRFSEAWIAAGNHGELWMQDEKDHFSAMYGYEDPTHRLCQTLCDFLR